MKNEINRAPRAKKPTKLFKATKVAVRAIPDGTEYLFTAVDLPREGAPEMPAHELQVYVTVANGEAPVFTQVVR